jgi:signal peptidase II
MTKGVRLVLLLTIMCGCVGCDQVTKVVARARLPFDRPISLLHDTLRLHYTQNSGAFLSLGDALPEQQRWLVFTVGGVILVAAALLWALRARTLSVLQTVGAALLCGGGLGNMIDRLSQSGHVTDFLNVGIGSLRTGIFNVADMALMLGAALVILSRSRQGTAGLPPREA